MKLTRVSVLLINIVVALTGIIAVMASTTMPTAVFKTLCEAVGIGLIATGAVNFLDRLLAPKPPKEVRPPVDMIATARTALSKTVHDRKHRASKVDIAGVSLAECLERLVNDPAQTMINRVLFNHTRFRVLLVHPDAPFIPQRAFEDGISYDKLRDLQKHSVALCIQFYAQLLRKYSAAFDGQASREAGSVVIKLIDSCPYITTDRADDEIYWGMYLSCTPGMNSPVFSATKEHNYALFDQLKSHFSSLLNAPSSRDLVTMVVGGPTLDRGLAEDILGKGRVQELLK